MHLKKTHHPQRPSLPAASLHVIPPIAHKRMVRLIAGAMNWLAGPKAWDLRNPTANPARRQLCLREASRVLRHGGRLLLIDYAGDPGGRKHWSARLGPHGRFDLHSLRKP